MTRLALLLLATLALAPATAHADGLPVGNVDAGPTGITTPGGADRIVTLAAGRGTVVARVSRAGGQVRVSRVLPGVLTIPAVALDGSAGGLSADGRTVIVIQPRLGFPRRVTRFAVLGAEHLQVRKRIRLRGDFSFDAISPDGRVVYLIHYLSRTDPTRYEVRGFDVRRGRLQAEAIVDPREPDEQMHGLPVTRAMSGDGRWAYTLYDGTEHPFVHALDTAGGTARCIDLAALTGNPDLFTMRLAPAAGGRALAVQLHGQPVALIDRTTFRVSAPAAAATATRPAPADDGDTPPWTAIIALTAGAAALAGAMTLGARRGARAGGGSPRAMARRWRRARSPARDPRA